MANVELLVHVNDNELVAVKREIKELTGRKHQINLDLKDIHTQIERMKQELRALSERRYAISLSGGDTREIDRQISALQIKLDTLTQQEYALKISSKEELVRIERQLAGLKQQQDDLNELQRIQKEEARATREEYEAQVQAIGKVADALKALGDISQLTENFAKSIGGAFSDVASVFNLNVFKTAKTELTRLATQSLVGDFGKITARYDIMSTFTDYMRLAGASADDAADALQRVNDSILGLPIGLDESAQRLRRYQMFLGDLNQATNLTIGLQKAIYAGGANEQMRQQSFYQIDRLLTVGKLNTTRQWNALLQGLGVSLRYVAEELGYEVNNVAEFAGMLSTGTVSVQEFLGALQSLGAGGSEAAAKLDEALGIYKGTMGSWLSNIRFAAVRGGVTVLNALDDVLKENTDTGIVGYLEKIRNSMNDLYKGIGNWITSNPESFTKNLEAAERLMYSLDRLNAGNIAAGIFDNLARGVDMLTDALNRLPAKEIEEFFVFATTLAGPLGKVFQAVSSGAGALVGVFRRFKDFDFESLISKIITQIELLAGVVEKLLSLISDSAMEDLLAFGLVWGGPLAKGLGVLAAGVLGLTAALKFLAPASAGAASALGVLGAAAPYVAAGVAMAVAAFAAITTGLAQAKRNVEEAKEAFGQKELDLLTGRSQRDIEELGKITIDLDVRDKAEKVREIRDIVDEIRALNKAAAEDNVVRVETQTDGKPAPAPGGYAEMRDLVDRVNEAVPGADLRIDPRTKTLDARSRQILEVIEAQEEYSLAAETAANAEDKLAKAEDVRNRLLKNQVALDEELAKKEDALAEKRRELENAYLQHENRRGLGSEVKALQEQRDQAQAQADANRAALAQANQKLSYFNRTAQDANTDMVAISGSDIAQTEWWAQLAPARAEVENLTEAYATLGEAAHESIEKQLAGFGKLEKEAGKSIENIEEALKTEQEILDRYNNNAKKVERYALETGDERLQAALEEASQMGINEGGAWIAGWNKAIQEAKETGDDTRLESMLTLYDENRDRQQMAEQASRFISAANEEFAEALEANKEDIAAFGSAWLDALWGDMKPSDLIKSMGDIGNLDSQNILGNTSLMAKKDAEETLPQYQEQLDATRDKLVEMKDTGVIPLQEAEDRATESTNQLEAAIQTLASTMSAKLPTVLAFKQGIELMEASVRVATSAVIALRDAINSLEDKTVTVTYNEVHTGSGEAGDGGANGDATGGLITGPGPAKYFTKGGSVFEKLFKPRGTDTVPAMLTPGEYVLRKKAVDRLGVPFLQRLNRLDIAGAFDALMSRIYIPNLSSMSAAYYNTYNSADNRQYNVNVRNERSSEDFVYFTASRFVRAL